MKITDSMNESSNQEGVENEGQSNSIKEQNLGEEEEKGSEMEIDVVIESSSPNNDESSAQ